MSKVNLYKIELSSYKMSWKRPNSYIHPSLGRLGVYGIFIGLMSTVLYPIMIYPMMNSDYYSEYIGYGYVSLSVCRVGGSQQRMTNTNL